MQHLLCDGQMEFIREQGELQVTFRDYKVSDTITRTIRDQTANTHTCLKNASQQKGGGGGARERGGEKCNNDTNFRCTVPHRSEVFCYSVQLKCIFISFIVIFFNLYYATEVAKSIILRFVLIVKAK